MAKLTVEKVLGEDSEEVEIPAEATFEITGTPTSGEEFKAITITYKDIQDGNNTVAVPVGTYKVEEKDADVDGYTLVTTYSEAAEVTKEKPEGTLTVTNTYTATNGAALIITKTVKSENSSDLTTKFNFTVTLDDNTINGKYGDVEFEDGVASFKLAHGEKVTIEDLPIGVKYTVEEENNKDFDTSKTGETGEIGTAKSEVKFTNTKRKDYNPPKTVIITVEKKWANDNNNAYGTRPKSVTVLLLRSGKEVGRVTLHEGNWQHTWGSLPGLYEEYSVEELDVEGYAKSISWKFDGNNPNSGRKYTITNTLTNLIDDHVAYIIGYPDGTVRPSRSITRAEVATIFFRLLTDDARDRYWSQTNSYTDVIPEAWYNNAISTLSNMGIINGYEDGTFRPDNPITRAELTKIAVSFFGSAGNNFKSSSFTDVADGAWYSRFIAAAEDLGLVYGYGDGTFLPDNLITRAEAFAIVNRTLRRAPHKDHLLPGYEMNVWPDNMDTNAWYYADVQEATNSHDYNWITDDAKTVEKWIEKLPERDWAALERVWSTSHAAPGKEVMN